MSSDKSVVDASTTVADAEATTDEKRKNAGRAATKAAKGADKSGCDDGNNVEAPAAGRFAFLAGDRVLWVIIVALIIISVLVVYSSTAKMAYNAHSERSAAIFLRQQFLILLVGVPLLIFTHRINSRVFHYLAPVAYMVSVMLTIAVYFMNVQTNGAARWFPVFGFQFQPSEALKIATVMFLARQLAARQTTIDKLRIVPSLRFWTWREPKQQKIWREGALPILMPVVVSCLVIFPAHTSSAMLVFLASLVMMFIGRVKMRELVKFVGLAVLGAVMVLALNLGRSETAGGRVGTWIHLWTQEQTSKPIEDLTDTERSMIAIHNGGILGKGAGQSQIRVEMTHPESDYAYAFFVEEYGLILSIVLLMLYLWIFFRAIEIFRQCGTAFPGLLVLGLALLITFQALLHIMVTVNFMPETGQTLPMISRGGSSVIFTAIALGMILSVSRQNDEKSHDTPRNETIYEK